MMSMQNSKTVQLFLISAALLSLLIVSTAFSNFVNAQNKFRAKLDADNEVPPVNSTAEGVATFKLKDDAIKSKINITGVTDISGAQIFMGKIGQNADPIVDLLKTGEKIESPGGVGIKGNFTSSDLQGSMQGKDLSELQSAMSANQTFVNIMTSENPDGELAGHIYPKGNTTGSEISTANDVGPEVPEEVTGEDTSEPAEDNTREEE